MKKVTLAVAALALAALTSAYAATPGTYVGLGLGGTRLDTQKQNLTVKSNNYSQNLGGVGGRIFTGYNFNQYLGMELGLADYAQSKYKASVAGVGNGTKKYNMYSLDLVGKAYLPVANGFNVYGLGGLALVSSKVQVSETGNVFANSTGSSSTTTRKVRPIVGLGTSYDINSNVTTALEYSHIQGTGNVKTSNSAIPNADMISLNVSYNFG